MGEHPRSELVFIKWAELVLPGRASERLTFSRPDHDADNGFSQSFDALIRAPGNRFTVSSGRAGRKSSLDRRWFRLRTCNAFRPRG